MSFAGIILSEPPTMEHALRSAVILTIFILLLFTSLVNLMVLWCKINDVISLYLISLSMADFLCALLIIPFSLYSSLRPGWAFMGDNSILCKCTVYAHVVLISSTVFTFAWISVDRYAAFMKPSRYEAVHTMTRCKCWILFSWITSLLLACPVLIAKMESNYSAQLELCLLNWGSTLAYSSTLAVLVLLPSVCTVVFTSSAIFAAMNKPEELEDIQRTILETDPNFIISLFILISCLLSWLPLIAFQFLPSQLLDQADSTVMRFAFTWLAIGGGSSKLLIYSFTSKQFRQSLCCCFSHAQTSAATSQAPIDELLENQQPQPQQGIHPNQIPNSTHSAAVPVVANSLSPIASFFSNVDYGSFGLGPIVGIGTGGQQQQQPQHFPSPQQNHHPQQHHPQAHPHQNHPQHPHPLPDVPHHHKHKRQHLPNKIS